MAVENKKTYASIPKTVVESNPQTSSIPVSTSKQAQPITEDVALVQDVLTGAARLTSLAKMDETKLQELIDSGKLVKFLDNVSNSNSEVVQDAIIEIYEHILNIGSLTLSGAVDNIGLYYNYYGLLSGTMPPQLITSTQLQAEKLSDFMTSEINKGAVPYRLAYNESRLNIVPSDVTIYNVVIENSVKAGSYKFCIAIVNGEYIDFISLSDDAKSIVNRFDIVGSEFMLESTATVSISKA